MCCIVLDHIGDLTDKVFTSWYIHIAIKQNRNINDLKSTFRERFILAMDEYNERYEPNIFVVEWLRSKELQAKYFKEWKTKTMKSNHLTGNAVDIAFLWTELYPKSNTPRINLCRVMRRYGIVNGYFDLKRWFDKPHFQAVEIQAPTKISDTYVVAKDWVQKLKSQMRARGVARHKRASQEWRDKLHERNEMARYILSVVEK